ncbi:MAG TPA: hypothetical protein VK580_09295 [Steroidobacteraceae bacterium]|nr:hypothetical protein [Steroidobacteraceae bacterium]
MPTFFATADDFAAWLGQHGASKSEFVVGYYKRGSKRPSMTWAESVDAALCYGWIDGVRKRIDEHSYQIRFTPRKPTSIWSHINIERARVLQREGKMREGGIYAYSHRREDKSRIYSYEQRKIAALAQRRITISKSQSGLEILRSTAGRLPTARHLAHCQCETSRDA